MLSHDRVLSMKGGGGGGGSNMRSKFGSLVARQYVVYTCIASQHTTANLIMNSSQRGGKIPCFSLPRKPCMIS